MLIETKTIIVKAGTSNLVVERFSKPGPIEEIEGFIDLNVLVKMQSVPTKRKRSSS